MFQDSVYINCLQYQFYSDNSLKFTIRSLDSLISLFFFFFVSTYCDHHWSLSHDTFESAVLTQRSLFMQQYYMTVVIMLKFISSNKNALTKSALSLNFCLFAILKLEPIQFTTGRAWPTWAPTGRLENSVHVCKGFYNLKVLGWPSAFRAKSIYHVVHVCVGMRQEFSLDPPLPVVVPLFH